MPKSRIILGLLALLLFLVLVFVVLSFLSFKKSSLLLFAAENKFKLHFDISKNDKTSFVKILENLNLPPNIENGFEFELDSTSSAKLTYLTPLKSSLDFNSQKIIFSGETSHNPFQNELRIENIKVPSSSNLVVFAPDFKDFIKARIILNPKLSDWFEKNLSSKEGQYLVIFGQNSDFSIIFKAKEIDFESLKYIQVASASEPFYKEEIEDNLTFHLLKLPEDQRTKQLNNITLFQLGPWVFLNSSYESAKYLLKVQKSQESSIDSFSKYPNKTTSFAIHFLNGNDSPINQSFLEVLFLDFTNLSIPKVKFAKVLDKVKEFEYFLNDKDFSGLIYIK